MVSVLYKKWLWVLASRTERRKVQRPQWWIDFYNHVQLFSTNLDSSMALNASSYRIAQILDRHEWNERTPKTYTLILFWLLL